jgi:adenylosuccinate lyase
MDFETYLSPFTWRYGSPKMRSLWSENHKRRLWRRIWVALAEIQAEYGLVRPDQVEELRRCQDQVDIQRSLELESEIQHDLMAELRTFAEQAGLSAGILHLGATSADIEDNADVLRTRESLALILEKCRFLLELFAEKILAYADMPVMAFTHLQPAEPTTLGYRLAFYAQDLLEGYKETLHFMDNLRGKGFKGAVGTGASYAELLDVPGRKGSQEFPGFEARLSELLDLPFYPVTTQVYSRSQDYRLLSALVGLSIPLYKFAFDLRLLQSPPLGELGEPFGTKQVGSSAMPFKRNPVHSEKIDSLARLLAGMPRLAWDNAAHSLLERTLDDSANRRVLLPEAFLVADELLQVMTGIIEGLVVDEVAVKRTLSDYGPFAGVERLLMVLVKAGADRQVMHEHLRQLAMAAWQAIKSGEDNPLTRLIQQDPLIGSHLEPAQIELIMDTASYLGDAPQRARQIAQQIKAAA